MPKAYLPRFTCICFESFLPTTNVFTYAKPALSVRPFVRDRFRCTTRSQGCQKTTRCELSRVSSDHLYLGSGTNAGREADRSNSGLRVFTSFSHNNGLDVVPPLFLVLLPSRYSRALFCPTRPSICSVQPCHSAVGNNISDQPQIKDRPVRPNSRHTP